jgi:hypothetical protein
MSSPVDQLRALLSRVEERRNAPRLRAVPAAVAQATPAANEVRPAERTSALPERKPPAGPTPLEHAIAGGLAPTPVPGNKPASMELDLDDFEAPQTAVAKAPATTPRGGEVAHRGAPTMPQTDPFAGDPFASSPPPAPAAKPAPAPAPAAAKAPAPAPARPAATPAPAPAPAPQPAPAPTAATARIAAPEPAASAPVARAMTRARVDTPRTFGELLDLSLSLRPRE